MPNKNNNLKRDMELIFEMGCFRYIPRAWRQFYNKDLANNAEHTFRVGWIAMVIGIREGADLGKIAKMALVHDLGESRTGDVHYLSRLYTSRNEKLAIQDIFEKTSLEKEFRKLWEEYQERATLESKIVKDADNLDVDFELREQLERGYKMPPTWHKMRDTVAKRLYTDTAKKLWNSVKRSSPHDWHALGKNRFTKGDWKKKKNVI